MLHDFPAIYDSVWRHDFRSPGFLAIDTPDLDSRRLRAWMVALEHELGAVASARGGQPFRIASLGRFDQQVTTKFHLDGAPDESLLVLGYEPSEVASDVRLADYSRAAHDMGLTPEEFLDRHNPMYRDGETLLAPYTTLLQPPPPGWSRILLINNSKRPHDGASPQGVLHQATIATPDPSRTRIINSMMLVTGGSRVPPDVPERFLSSDDTSGPIEPRYGDRT